MTAPQLKPVLEKIDKLLAEKIDKESPGYIAAIVHNGKIIFSKRKIQQQLTMNGS